MCSLQMEHELPPQVKMGSLSQLNLRGFYATFITVKKMKNNAASHLMAHERRGGHPDFPCVAFENRSISAAWTRVLQAP